ncbi:hypothetical protein HNQ91_001501 [Filimonas zeae]|uniref:Uncharacterized protein n=1 Tax=Filimonas zeae TaxID=1737353 RepID=A0A917J0Z2_9BACT|nr:hypothetical protein [Filimonas zeae]MDR6338450.1 hypothetical protein [Filimonas zeae]GGH68206.1 hypothetical protein GCM10011379_24270 [Filimonas zeae]
MLNSNTGFLIRFSNLTNQLSELSLQEQPAKQLTTFSNTCHQLIKITLEEQHHPEMADTFSKNLPGLVQLINKCYRLSQQNTPDALAYSRFTEASLEVFEHCIDGTQQQYLPLYLKMPDALVIKESAWFDTQCRQLMQRGINGKMAGLIEIAIQPLYNIATASPMRPFSFLELQEARKHLYNLETASTEKELLSVLYGVNYNTDTFIHWLLHYLQAETDRMPFASTRKEYLEAIAHEMQMARFNPALKRPAQPFDSHNDCIYACMHPFFFRQLNQLEHAPAQNITEKINIETDTMTTIAWLLRLILEALGLPTRNISQLVSIASTIFCFKNVPATDPANFGPYSQPKRLNADVLNRLAYILETALQKVRELQDKHKRKGPDTDKD